MARRESDVKGLSAASCLRGVIVSIHVAPYTGTSITSVDKVRVVAGRRVEGDRYFKHLGTPSDELAPNREPTQMEIQAIDALKRDPNIDLEPGATRRNFVTRAVSLNRLVDIRFRVGEAALRGIRLCEPWVLGKLDSPSRSW